MTRLQTIFAMCFLVLFVLPLIGAGCTGEPIEFRPPKPPIPGMQRSPAIERPAP